MSSAPKRNSTMRVTRTQTMGGSTTIQKGGKKGAAAGQKKVAEKTGGQDDAVAQDKQLEQQLYRTLSMGRKRAKKAAAKTTDKAQSAAASAPLERKKDLALEDMTFEVDDPEWDREMEARKRRHKEDMIDENVAEEGGMGKVPWNPWFTRIGRMNAYSPVEVMDYYWIRHSTGLSYAYLLVCTLMFILFVGLALQKWQDASVQMTAFTKQPSLTTKNDFGTLPYLNGFLFSPKETNRTFTIVSAPLSYVYYEWSLCTDTLHRGVDVNSSISGFLTDGTAYFYNTSCTRLDTLPCQYGYCFNNPQSLHYTEMADQRQYVRFRLLRCRNETLDLGQITSGLRCKNTTRDLESEMDGATITFQGQSVDNIPTIGKKYGVDYTAYRRFYYRAGSSEEVNINMELRNIVENPRFIIDGLDSTMTAFSSISSSVRPRDILSDQDITFFTAKFSLVSPKKEITLKSANILQTIASVCAVCTVLYTLGYGVRAFNRWDFYRNGKFELAELPGDYMENLFDSTRDLELPGYRDLVKSKIENEKKDTEVTLDDIKRKIVDLRKGLAPLIGVAAQQAKIRKKRA